ncbi:MAG: hypothetical protein J3K34DRAFT_463241 [Monoraphidium minutum]|nr:MAG: hypothetical protein J3K34DRAFT_463241 [Monoraphidium minutum]
MRMHFKLELKPGHGIKRMHGALGQSLHWAPNAPAVVEGGDDFAYALADGLLGRGFKYNLFGSTATKAALSSRKARKALSTASGTRLVAGSAAMVA